ncbi:UDP-phosphate alpha-N-acetylglucosaminyl 1-phosphate transferase [Marinobacterium rhizophilum]|uniref:UDP-phosphate alpha-N-acetylglucosaminyl 1-phosphate transferase n=1 Tax=Marinobacterium rhizophilum TaxID=420402 RepID=A0ABY5HGA6_9GAMM|nr:UDP-phosphate alpha-N-acetylglucosaminyl 1-phosphate transferase [Marinobacterium rhizophilum]UTW10638.1 UDP-phosphate alpha-N-acetylglucosaminyl 1-phosphate transferase [Marinobacterium rhizophilum]
MAIYTGLMVTLLAFLPVSEKIAYLLGTASFIMLTGLIDDIRDLGVRVRLLIQAVASLAMIAGTGLYIESLGDLFGFGEVYLGLWGIPFTVLAVIGVINAFNMVDGIDGLAGGLSLVAILGILAFEGLAGNYRNVDYLLLLACALVPFLLANLGIISRRKIFMGDAGSMFMGYVITWTLINLTQGESQVIEPVNALWCVAIPVMDTLGVMYRRIKRGQSPFQPDREHLHHIFMRAGFCARKTLLTILGSAVAIILLGLVIEAVFPALALYGFSALFLGYGYLLMHAWKLQKLMKGH